jgi:radical SAM protein with 4Fe4S-binding SPASM domain
MSEECFNEIIRDLKSINYKGEIHPYFRNEPGCDPDIYDKVYRLREEFPENIISVHTNGDYGASFFKFCKDPFVEANRIQVNDYDNPNFKQSKHYKLFSNRAGKVSEKPEKVRKQCSFPLFKMMIMYDGNIPLCCNDWDCEVRLGNIMESSITNIWSSPVWRHYREHQVAGNGKQLYLCERCNHI